ncbi:4544_t:CDS:2, partial [Entrophospora sp. SA101]
KTFLFKTSWPLLELQKKIKECFDDLLEDIELEYIQIVPNGADYKIDDNEFLSELWDLAKKDNSRHSCITFGVVTTQQDFSSYKSLSKVLRTFGINDISSLVDIPQFTLGKYEYDIEVNIENKTIKALFKEIKIRLKACGPVIGGHANEALRSEFISPFMNHAVAESKEGTKLRPQKRISGTYGKGFVDYAICYKSSVICITEAKTNELEIGLTQNLKQLQAAAQMNIKKCKSPDSSEALYGIVTTGVEWLFVLFSVCLDKINIAATSRSILRLNVDMENVNLDELSDQVVKIYTTIKSLLTDQVRINDKIEENMLSNDENAKPSTPNKPIIQPKLKQLYSQFAFTKRVKIACDKEKENQYQSDNNGNKVLAELKNIKNHDDHNDQNQVVAFSIEEIRIQILSPYIAKNEFENTMIKYIGKVLMDLQYIKQRPIKADIVGVRLSDNHQVIFLEMSGAPTDFLKNHPISDANKTLQERMDSLNSVLLNFLCYDVRFVWKVHSLSIQGI